jgi:hypothetical protein
MKTIFTNFQAYRSIYDERQKINPKLTGLVYVQFFINASGKVIYSKVLKNTTNDTVFEVQICNELKKMDFGKIYLLSDITEVRYAFVFTK